MSAISPFPFHIGSVILIHQTCGKRSSLIWFVRLVSHIVPVGSYIFLNVEYYRAIHLFRTFEKLAYYFDSHLDYIPLTFMLGFFVQIVVRRWSVLFENMGYVERYTFFGIIQLFTWIFTFWRRQFDFSGNSKNLYSDFKGYVTLAVVTNKIQFMYKFGVNLCWFESVVVKFDPFYKSLVGSNFMLGFFKSFIKF